VTPIAITRLATYGGLIPNEAGYPPASASQAVFQYADAIIPGYLYGDAIRRELEAFRTSEDIANQCILSSMPSRVHGIGGLLPFVLLNRARLIIEQVALAIRWWWCSVPSIQRAIRLNSATSCTISRVKSSSALSSRRITCHSISRKALSMRLYVLVGRLHDSQSTIMTTATCALSLFLDSNSDSIMMMMMVVVVVVGYCHHQPTSFGYIVHRISSLELFMHWLYSVASPALP
jgi:hypothetical protein